MRIGPREWLSEDVAEEKRKKKTWSFPSNVQSFHFMRKMGCALSYAFFFKRWLALFPPCPSLWLSFPSLFPSISLLITSKILIIRCHFHCFLNEWMLPHSTKFRKSTSLYHSLSSITILKSFFTSLNIGFPIYKKKKKKERKGKSEKTKTNGLKYSLKKKLPWSKRKKINYPPKKLISSNLLVCRLVAY